MVAVCALLILAVTVADGILPTVNSVNIKNVGAPLPVLPTVAVGVLAIVIALLHRRSND
jgi:hypothetical protein